MMPRTLLQEMPVHLMSERTEADAGEAVGRVDGEPAKRRLR